MAAWVVITADDLNDYLVAAQVSALRQAARASGQADPFASVMEARCNYIRNRISKRISISATALAIPPELKSQACYLIIEAMQARLPGLPITEDQRTAIRRAYEDLDLAGSDEFPISTPDDPTTPTIQGGASISIVTKGSTNQLTRDRMRGL